MTQRKAPPRRYAEGTEVSETRSQQEIETLLRRYGATKFARGWGEGERHALVGFEMAGRQIRIVLPFPPEEEFAYQPGQSYRRRTDKQRREAWEQEVRRRWRALLLVLKAQLEAVASSILTIEEAMLPWVVLPSGQTMAEWASPQIARLCETGNMPPMLPGLPELPPGGER